MSDTDYAALEQLVAEYLLGYRYWNLGLFIQGCEPDPLQRKVSDVIADKPAICYQHNEALYNRLLSAGWTADRIERRAALVIKTFQDDTKNDRLVSAATAPISHSMMLVDGCYILDVGFSNNVTRGPIPFHFRNEEGVTYRDTGDSYKFELCRGFCHSSFPADEEWWSLFVLVDHRWFELYRFPGKHVMSYQDIERDNMELFRSPMPIVIRDNVLVAAMVTAEARHQLMVPRRHHAKPLTGSMGSEEIDNAVRPKEDPKSQVPSPVASPMSMAANYSQIFRDGSKRVMPIVNWGEFTLCLRDVFGIQPPEEKQVLLRWLDLEE